MSVPEAPKHGLMLRVVEAFLKGNLSVVLILISLIAGAVSLLITPREEDPQIVVPMADVFVTVPGASARQVERQVTTRLEELLYQIDGVEYVYSTSYAGQAVVTVRFYVGQNREQSWVKLYNKIHSNIDQVPAEVAGWVVKPMEIDDVPIVNLTLYSARYSDYDLRRMAEELEIRLQAVSNAGRTDIHGGRPRAVTVHLSPARMAAHHVPLENITLALRAANVTLLSGDLLRTNEVIQFQAGGFLTSADEAGRLVVAVDDLRPVFLRDVAELHDGPAEADTYTRIAFGPQAYGPYDPVATDRSLPPDIRRFEDYPAVTVAVAKRKGSNAVWVSEDIEKAAAQFKRDVLPDGVYLRVTRDYGRNANDKVNDLVEDLAVALVVVIALLTYSLGWREGIIIALAVPITFSVTLLINYLFGYSINRVTLFALILSLGLVVDDPIVDVENVYRHLVMRREDPYDAVLLAVSEVRPPIIFATLAVIISFVPLFFITGMMGPYMAPMALNVPVAMLMSLLVSFTVTPWLSYHVLKNVYQHNHAPSVSLEQSHLYRAYSAVMSPVLNRRAARWGIVAVILLLMAFSVWLVLAERIPLKMLPFDNKDTLQVVIDMPAGTTLETTEADTHALADYLVRVPEVTDVSTFAGSHSPMDFNGLVRHYYLRRGPHVADIVFNLAAKTRREQQSHAIGLRVRDGLKQIARPRNANIKIVETPPGPPVLSTLVAEVYGHRGRPYEEAVAAARRVRRLMEETPDVVDVDDVIVAPEKKIVFRVDRTRAALHRISDEQIAGLLNDAVKGGAPANLRLADPLNPIPILLQLPRRDRSQNTSLEQFTVSNPSGEAVPLLELGTFEQTTIDQPIYHKNLRPLVYVFGDTAGLPPPDAVFTLTDKVRADPALAGYDVDWSGEGEWHITLKVFRDLGIAFGVAVLGIYILLLYQTGSYLLPVIQLIALPLSIIGIIPGFWLLNLLTSHPVGGWANPVYFTATAMIGVIALAGIATRNSILLIEFVEERQKQGKPLRDSLLEAGALRTRPILLTAGAAMLAAWPITLDPIFSGLAWALIFGLAISTLFTLVVVPMAYHAAYARKPPGGRGTS
jgi:multidrug efflux pump subunit AcrB